jgi:CHAD domain-containing protein
MGVKQAEPKSPSRDEGTCIYGAGVLLKHVLALGGEIAGVHTGDEDIEFIHRARVASRRLRAAMPLFANCLPARKTQTWLRHIRDVTRALGEARDTDVQIERLEKISKKILEANLRPGVLRLLLRLRQKRAGLQPTVTAAMSKLMEKSILDQMSSRFSRLSSRADEVYIYSPALYRHSFQSITTRLDNLLAYDAIVSQPDKVIELHEMRIRAKWLRYTIENFSTLYASELKEQLQIVRKIQEMLGEIHDCDVWSEFIPRFIEEERLRTQEYYGHTRFFKRLVPGIEYFLENRKQTRAELYTEFSSAWETWRAEGAWINLRQAVQVHFPQPESVYPSSPAILPGAEKPV